MFCEYAAGRTEEARQRVVFRDESVTAFHDRTPKAHVHLLVVPNHHVRSVGDLRADDAALAAHLHAVASRLLDEAVPAGASRRFGYHPHPWYSVPHLHLHALGGSFTSWWKRLKYLELWGALEAPWWRRSEGVLARLGAGAGASSPSPPAQL